MTGISSLNASDTTAPNMKEHERQNVLLEIHGFLSVVLRNLSSQDSDKDRCISHGWPESSIARTDFCAKCSDISVKELHSMKKSY